MASSPHTAVGRRQQGATQPFSATEVAAFRVVHLEERADAEAIDLGYRGSIQLMDPANAGKTAADRRRDGVVAICHRIAWAPVESDEDAVGGGEAGASAVTVAEEDEFSVWVGSYASAYDAAVQVRRLKIL